MLKKIVNNGTEEIGLVTPTLGCQLTQDTQYIFLMGELWNLFCKYFGEKTQGWPVNSSPPTAAYMRQ